MMLRLVATLAATLLAAGPAAACLVCIELPERTVVDRLVEAEIVAVAREDPGRPFTYAPVALLRGADPPPIPLLVDSATRRRLAAAPADAVVMAYEEGGWTQLAYADPAMRRTVEAILAAAPGWATEGPAARFAFFVERHDHPDAAIRELALAEISAAPYALIRTIRPRVPRAEIAATLRDPSRMAWAPIHILFLGLSEDPADHALVRRVIDVAARHGVATHLGAWATAYAEIDGPPAVERLRAIHFADPSRPEALRAVVTAFSTLARDGDPALRPSIDAAFRALAAEGPPALAGEAAKQLAWAQDWSQADAFAERLATGALADPAAEYVIALYLEAAREALGPADLPTDRSLK